MGTTFTESGVVAVSMIGGLIKIDDDAESEIEALGSLPQPGNRYESA